MSQTTQENHYVIQNTEGEVIIRHGEALPVKHPTAVRISGTLNAPADFLAGKKTWLDENQSDTHLQIFMDQGRLVLHINDTDPFTEHIIEGSLKQDGVLQRFRINSDKRWGVQEFLKFIKTMRYYFAQPSQCNELVKSLMNWSAKVETVIKDNQDTSGNSLMMLEKKVGDIALERKFDLNIPIFQGYPKAKVSVEIGFEPSANKVDLYLISDDLIETEIALREKYMDVALKGLKDYGFSKVVIS